MSQKLISCLIKQGCIFFTIGYLNQYCYFVCKNKTFLVLFYLHIKIYKSAEVILLIKSYTLVRNVIKD